MTNLDNWNKQRSGQNFQVALEAKFVELINSGVILSFEKNINFCHSGFGYQAQYLANFVLKTIDEKFIIVRSSNSYRSDRVKTPYWDIQGIVENSEISKDIIATVLLYPDKEGQEKQFKSGRGLVDSGEAYAPVSHIFLESEFLEFLDNYKDEVESALDEAVSVSDGQTQFTVALTGSEYAKRGIYYEKQLVAVLQDQSNLQRFKETKLEETDPFSQVLRTICENEKISIENIDRLNATDTVPLLRSGGNPKTDIILELLHKGSVTKCTLSVKVSEKSKVTCHDYKAEDYVRVLGCFGETLETYLMKFQANPSYKSFSDALAADESIDEFVTLMGPHATKFAEWALTGAHDSRNLIPEAHHVSNYLFVASEGETFCQPMAAYIKQLFLMTTLTYGVPFSWTYPSKQRGKRIQLKVPLVRGFNLPVQHAG